MIGKTVTHYKILDKLGEGGMGVVYKAQDLKLDRTVAVKFLPPGANADAEAKKRFIQEAKAASSLDHPNICTIHEIDETSDGQLFIVTSCYEGETLKELLQKAAPNLEKAVEIAVQLSSGLAKAHEHGIVHRDIKPGNIFITRDGQVKILDFGLAKLAGQTKITKTGGTLGTVAYMSPEQARGEEVDSRSDIFSLGVVLYELLTGHLPFKGEHEAAVLYGILNTTPVPITELRTDLPLELERIVGACLEKNVERRYQRAADVHRDVSRVHQNVLLPERHMQGSKRSRTGRRQFRAGIVIAALALIAAVAGFFSLRGILVGRHEVAAGRIMLAVLPFENLGSPEDEFFAAGVTEEITSMLASVRGLGVISRTSAGQYASTTKTIKQIGEELGVEYILEGTVRWAKNPGSSDRVRVTPQLIRVSDDTHIWADEYDHVIDNIFEVQSSIAQEVFNKLGVALLDVEQQTVQAQPTSNVDAYQAYLRGRYYLRQPHFTVENWLLALKSFQHAVELDSGFVLAYAQLSKAHARLYYFFADASDERRAMAQRAIDKALDLAPDSPEVHLALGYYFFWAERDAARALEQFEIAAQSLHENAEVLEAKAELLRMRGQWQQALESYEKACTLSPRDAEPREEVAITKWWMRKYPESLADANKAITLAPDQMWPYLAKAFNYWSWNGNLEEARTTLESISHKDDWVEWTWYWQRIFEGRYEEALDGLSSILGGWIRTKMGAAPVSLFAAQVYEIRGEHDRAIASYRSARNSLESAVRAYPFDPRYHCSLGIAYAALGRTEDAIREGKRAVELLPMSKDAVYGIPYRIDLAHIYTMVQEYEAACDEFEFLLSVPGWISVNWLRLDPLCNPLREYPRFQRMLETYSAAH